MNKSVIGQVMAIFIFVVPAIILGWIMSGSGSGGSGGSITTVAGWMAGVVVAVLVIYFAGAIAWKYREKGKFAVSGVKKLFDSKDDERKGFVIRWWAKKDDEGKRFMWYIVVITVAYLASYMAPDGKEAVFRGVVALIGVHIIWTFLSTGEIGVFTWTVVLGMVTYFVLAWGYPKDAPRIFDASWGLSKKVMTNVADTAQSMNENYGKPATETKTGPEVSAPKAYQPETRKIEVIATKDRFTYVKIPSGVQFSIDCPDDGLAEVFHRGAQQGIIYDCAQNIEVGENLHNFRIGFSAKTEAPVKVVVRITS